jgi:S-formylglutathione hydrolase FrmB
MQKNSVAEYAKILLLLAVLYYLLIITQKVSHVPPGLLQTIQLKSEQLSSFWGKPILMRASVLLPKSYRAEKDRYYPVMFHIHGFAGSNEEADERGEIILELMKEKPSTHMIHVFLDASFPRGHNFFVNSENNGPWGDALVKEFIPFLAKQFRITKDYRGRFLTGHSSGGWSALWLQVSYPDQFGGVWATSPDPVDFKHFFGIDITPESQQNFFTASDGQERLVTRGGKQTLRSYITRLEARYHGFSDFAAYERAWSPKDEKGNPLSLFDRQSGELNQAALGAWQKFNIYQLIAKSRDRALVKKLHIFCGVEDTYFLNEPTASFCELLKTIDHTAECELVPARDHSNLYAPYTTFPSGLEARIYQEAEASFAEALH